jgi:hypothetical protein
LPDALERRQASERRQAARAAALALILAGALGVGACGSGDGGSSDGGGSGPEAQWSVFEDHTALIRSGPERRAQTLAELERLGADTLRIEFKWNELAPAPLARRPPSFDASNPADYPGFAPYDELVREASAKGFRIIGVLAPEAPRWATEGGRGRSPEKANLRPIPADFARFAGAVAKRYSGSYRDLPKVGWLSIWNEPNHKLFLKPLSEAPAIYRRLVQAAVPAVRANAADDVKVLVGETAPAGRAGKSLGPAEFMRSWLCLDAGFQPVSSGGCKGFEKVDADGFAHHPYGPVDVVPPGRDIVNLLAITRLGDYLDRAAEADRLPAALEIYDTEFGLQSNPPDPTVSTTLARQAALLNEKEELSYRYPRLRSYAQYLLYDDPERPGPPGVAWSGFQTGLRFADGRAKPAWVAYRLPIVVHLGGSGVRIWGRVRPGKGTRAVQLQRLHFGRFAASGPRIKTDGGGYFSATRPDQAKYRFKAFRADGNSIGTSRVASPIP